MPDKLLLNVLHRTDGPLGFQSVGRPPTLRDRYRHPEE